MVVMATGPIAESRFLRRGMPYIYHFFGWVSLSCMQTYMDIVTSAETREGVSMQLHSQGRRALHPNANDPQVMSHGHVKFGQPIWGLYPLEFLSGRSNIMTTIKLKLIAITVSKFGY